MSNARCPECLEPFPGGQAGGHCRGGAYLGCCRTFRSDAAFEAHRRGPFDDRRCIDVTTAEGWRSTPRGWTNASEYRPDASSDLRVEANAATAGQSGIPVTPRPESGSNPGSRDVA